MHCLFDSSLVNDSFGDPGLYVDFRDQRRALLFDLGDVSGLPPRRLLRLSHVFVTHAHMDHFAGFDHLLRVVLGRKAQIVLVGGPGFVAQVEHKLRAYTWNVVHRYEVPLLIEARELGVDGGGACARFSSRSGFEREPDAPLTIAAAAGDVLHDEPAFRVRARFVDHGTPCLAYAIEEKLRVGIDKDRLLAQGLAAGAWLGRLKHALLTGQSDDTLLDVQWRDRQGEHATRRALGDLRSLVVDIAPGQKLGYVTDLRYTEENVEALVQLLAGVDQLYIESVFLDADAQHGARKHHLTARQAGRIARRIGARMVVPFHFSPRYQGRAQALVDELQAAWAGPLAAPHRDGVRG
ncbi:MAG: ribonuclease Z [Betaproteobacteria bacterium]|nr:ribonuclease Z [Betaproteobacteria bacterium]